MTKSAIGSRKKANDTAICNACGETCTRHTSDVRGEGWDCLWCGYLKNFEVNAISNIPSPTYSDGTPVRFPEEQTVAEPAIAE